MTCCVITHPHAHVCTASTRTCTVSAVVGGACGQTDSIRLTKVAWMKHSGCQRFVSLVQLLGFSLGFIDSGIQGFLFTFFLKRTHQYFNFYCALWIPPAIFLRFFSLSNQVGNPVVLLEKLQRAELSERVFESGPDSPFAAAYKASSPKLPRQLSHSTASAG